MAKVGIRTIKSGTLKKLNDMVKRASNPEAYLNRVVYPEYQNAQRERWMSQNAGKDFEGGRWKAIAPKYAAWKKEKYKSFPGGGTKLNIATGRLVDSATGSSRKFHKKIVEKNSLKVYTTVSYAPYVDEARTITKFSRSFYRKLVLGFWRYMKDGQTGRIR